ncbi:MAG: sodium:proton antiporter [Methanosarcinaceae archaeon]|nr:sodium:proton antiporter [Methanosarcinaceae archaeon]
MSSLVTISGVLFALLFITVVSQILSNKLQIPSIIFLLILGIVIGPEVLKITNPTEHVSIISPVISILVAIVVFEGGLNVNIKQMRTVYESVISLASVGVVIGFIGITLVTKFLVPGISWEIAALFGALMTATGPTVVGPIIRNIRVSRKLTGTLELEGILNDAASVILAALVFEWIIAEMTGASVFSFVLQRLLIGIIIGSLAGLFLKKIFTNGKSLKERNVKFLTLGILFASYGLSEYLGNESGILTAAIFGIILGSTDSPYKETIKEFFGDIITVAISFIFLALAGMLKFEYMLKIGLAGVIVVLIMALVIRPIAVFVSMSRSTLNTREKAFISFLGPKGVVPTSVATYFAFRLNETGIEGGQMLMGLVFMAVIITVIINGAFAKKVAKLLKVIPMEILIVGGGKVGQILAKRFDERGENVMVVDLDSENVTSCTKLGVQAIQGNGEDINVLRKAGIENAKYLIAVTNKDNTNLLLCQIAKTTFGLDSKQIIAKVNDMENLQAFWDLGVRAMSSEMTTAVVIDDMVGTPHLFAMTEVGSGGTVSEVKVTNPKVIGKAVKDIKFPENSLLVMINRDEESIIAHGNLVLQEGDIVTVIGEGDAGKKTAAILNR